MSRGFPAKDAVLSILLTSATRSLVAFFFPDAGLLVCTGVCGLLSFIVLILYMRWHRRNP